MKLHKDVTRNKTVMLQNCFGIWSINTCVIIMRDLPIPWSFLNIQERIVTMVHCWSPLESYSGPEGGETPSAAAV